MDSKKFQKDLVDWKIQLPLIKQGEKVKGKVLKKVENWLLINCANWAFIGVILPKEVKDLERKWVDLSEGREIEAEILDPDLKEDEWYFIVSVSKLLQYDYWRSVLEKHDTDDIITVVPTEANLWGLLVDILWIKWFIPLSQLAPVNYPRVEDWDQEKIFDKILSLIWKEFKVRIINIDENGKRMILSEREALREEREDIMSRLKTWSEFEWVISGVSSYWLFVTIWGGIEWLVHISEITFGHVDSINRYGKVWEKVKVKVIWLEDGKISLSMKKLKWDPWSEIPKNFKIWDLVEWEVIRFVPYGAFIRVYDDVNWLIHISEMTDRPISNPAEVVRLWQVVKAKLILLDPERRKLGLSLKAMKEDTTKVERKPKKEESVEKTEAPKKAPKKIVSKKQDSKVE